MYKANIDRLIARSKEIDEEIKNGKLVGTDLFKRMIELDQIQFGLSLEFESDAMHISMKANELRQKTLKRVLELMQELPNELKEKYPDLFKDQ